jgi:hypothetical protein
MTDQLPSKERNGPPFTVDRYGTLAAAVTAERDWLRGEVERVTRKLDTCGLECSEGLNRLAAENERLKREAAEARDLLNSEWFQRVTYKQQARKAQEENERLRTTLTGITMVARCEHGNPIDPTGGYVCLKCFNTAKPTTTSGSTLPPGDGQ